VRHLLQGPLRRLEGRTSGGAVTQKSAWEPWGRPRLTAYPGAVPHQQSRIQDADTTAGYGTGYRCG